MGLAVFPPLDFMTITGLHFSRDLGGPEASPGCASPFLCLVAETSELMLALSSEVPDFTKWNFRVLCVSSSIIRNIEHNASVLLLC